MDTIRIIISLAISPWTFLMLSIAYCKVYHKTATLAELTNVMTTIFISIIIVSNNISLASKRLQIRSILGKMHEIVVVDDKCCVVQIISIRFSCFFFLFYEGSYW